MKEMEAVGQNAPVSGVNSSSDFVRKLYKMLEDPSHDQVVRWGNDGDSFVVLENERFTKAILPKHFKHSNFASFVRQLNKYDFHKVRHNNEESGQCPYGANAWEFKHPEFKINSKASLENIRRKAPATRKSIQAGDDLVPTPQMDLVNTQLVAMQQQLQQLSDRYRDLSMHYSMLLTELLGVQKSVVNHEHVMQNVMTYLHSADSLIRDHPRGSRHERAFGAAARNGVVPGMASSPQQMSPLDDGVSSPLQSAEKLLRDTSTETLMHHRNLQQMSEMYRQATAPVSSTSPETPRDGPALSDPGRSTSLVPEGSASIDYTRLHSDLRDVVYPIGQNNGIDPMFSEHINNIPYAMPVAGEIMPTDPRKQYNEGRKKSTTIDPGWIRSPQILLVEDDPTCRRIGSKFLYSFKCHIDSAFDGLEAVNKMNGGSKYDLVLMDIIMPNLDGISACHLIRQFDTTPIIAMTSNIRSDDISMYFTHGMNDVLPKPFTKEGLLTMLEKHLGHLKDTRVPDTMPHPQVPHGSSRQSLKDDNSSIKSEGTSTWQSPTQIPGISPTSHGLSEEYVNALGRTGPYALDTSAHPDALNYHSPDRPMAAPRPGMHRRQTSQISDISGSDEQEAKRQRIFPPPPTPTHRNSIQRTMSFS